MATRRELDLLDIQTYWIYCQGIFTFIIFMILAMTSNDWSVKKLKRNWKKLHQLTYLAMFLLLWHIIDKMWGHWTWLTPPSLLITGTVTLLFLIRMIREQSEQLEQASESGSVQSIDTKNN